MTSLVVAVIAFILLIIKLITKMQAYPIVIYLQENPVSVADIPFPSVAICPPLNFDIDTFDYRSIADSLKAGELLVGNLSLDE